MAADGSVVIEILGDAKDITSKLTGIAGGAVKTLTTAIAGVGTALTGVSAAAIKVGAGFEQSMSQVAATMGLSVEEIQNGSAEFELLSQAAKDAGATTAFSASEAASALNYLALAGYDAQTSAEVLPSVLNLAAAGGMDLAYASDLATDAMAALGIEASKANLEQFGDQLAAAASNANASVAQLGEAILVVGGTAKSLAGGTTELNAALGVLANRGIKGAEGGTALRNIILSLSAPTDKAAKLMEELGVAVYDAEGKMRPLNDVFQDLDASMEGMTEGEKTNVLNDIFNKVDLKSAQALLAGTGEEFDDLAAAIENSQGAMEDMAAVQLDNLNGDITILKSGLEGLGIALYETMNVNARGAVQSITGAVSAISEALTNGGIPAAIQVAGQQLAQFATAIAQQAPSVISSAVSLIQAFLQGIRDNLPGLVSAALDIVGSLAAGILELAPDIASTGIEILVTLADGIIEAIPQMVEQLPQIITGFVEFITENLPTILDKGIELLVALATGIISAIPELVNELPKIIQAIANTIGKNFPTIIKVGVDLLGALIKGLITAIPTLIANIPQIISAIVSGLKNGVSAIGEAGKYLIEGLWNGISDMAGWIAEKIQGFGEGVLDSLKDFFGIKSPSRVMRDEVGKMIGEGVAKGITDSTPDAVKSADEMAEGVLNSLKALVDEYEDAWDDAVKLQNDMFSDLTKVNARDLFEKTDTGNIQLFDLQKDIDEINAYGDAINGLKNRMVSASLLDEVLSMGMEDATAFSNELLSMSDEEYDAYMALWDKKQEAAAQVSSSIYSDEFGNLQAEFSAQIESLAEDMPDEMKPIGQDAIQALTDGMSEKGAEAIAVAESIADDIAEQLSRITDLSGQMRSAVEAESARLSAQLTISSNAPAEARAARDRTNAYQNAAANAAVGNAVYPPVDVTLTMDGDVLARKQVDPMRKAFAEKPEVLDDER